MITVRREKSISVAGFDVLCTERRVLGSTGLLDFARPLQYR
jgi:hypothetical protein